MGESYSRNRVCANGAVSYRSSHALDLERHDVRDGDRLMGEERLTESGTDERSVMRVLGFHETVQVLAGRKDLPRAHGAVELARVAADGGHLSLELVSDVHDERRLDRIFAVGERVEDLVRAM